MPGPRPFPPDRSRPTRGADRSSGPSRPRHSRSGRRPARRLRAVAHAVQAPPRKRQGLGHLVRDHAAADHRPAQLRRLEDVARKLPALNLGKRRHRRLRGIEWPLCRAHANPLRTPCQTTSILDEKGRPLPRHVIRKGGVHTRGITPRTSLSCYSTSILWTQPNLSSISPDWMPVRVSRSFFITGPTCSMP